MIKTFLLLNFNTADSMGDVFLPGSVKMPTRPVRVFKEFDVTQPPIGQVVSLIEIGGQLFCEADLAEDCTGLYPAIGFQVDINETAGKKRAFKSVKLMDIGVCTLKNMDETIPPIA